MYVFMTNIAMMFAYFNNYYSDPIANATSSTWFNTALGDGSHFDAVLVLVHMDADDEIIDQILAAIRKIVPHKPIQFIAGHSHMRKQRVLDNHAAVFEPGNYFNTLGVATFSLSAESVQLTGTNFQGLFPFYIFFVKGLN